MFKGFTCKRIKTMRPNEERRTRKRPLVAKNKTKIAKQKLNGVGGTYTKQLYKVIVD